MSRHDHDGGLAADLRILAGRLTRRRALGMLGAAGLVPLVGCGDGGGSGDDAPPDHDAAGILPDADDDGCAVIPSETAGPFPGDSILVTAGVVRSDIRTSIGDASGTAAGVELTLTFELVDADGCAPLAGRAIYVWHCDRDGAYSMYAGTAEAENYLRGVQETDAEGRCSFTTVFPGCYPGRWPHVHFEVFDSLDAATRGGASTRISQLAFPEDSCDAVYATKGYETSADAIAPLSIATDGVFADGAADQIATMTVDGDRHVATLRVAV